MKKQKNVVVQYSPICFEVSKRRFFQEKVNAIQSNYTKEQAKEIDTLLFDLYNLTDDERKIIGFVEIV